MPANPYLRRILNARVYDVAIETPLEPAPQLSARLGVTVLLKREDLQPVFSFKLRGAYNKMVNLPAAALRRGVIAASAGNHAQGVALAARKLGARALIVMPVTTPEVKVDAVRALGAEVVLHGDSFSDAYARALVLQRRRKLTFVHPFDDPDVIAGQGTVGLEILRQHHPKDHGPLHAIFVAIGGGGLISGVAAYVKAVRPEIKIIGVQSVDSDAMARSLAAGRRITLREVGLFSDGTAVRQVGRETFRLCRRYVDDIVTVDNDALCAAIKDVFQETRSHPRAGRRARRGGGQGLRGAGAARRDDCRGDLRRQHELRSAAVRRRAGRDGGEARGGLRRDHPRRAGQLQAPLPAGRRPQRHRVQLPDLRQRRRPGLRRCPAGSPGRDPGAGRARSSGRASRRSI